MSVKAVYRGLLRRVIAAEQVNGSLQWRHFLRREFRSKLAEQSPGSASADPVVAQQLLTDATETLFALESLDDYEALLIKYNVGAYIEPREKIRKTAAMVGLHVDPWVEPEGEDVSEKYKAQVDLSNKKY